MGILRISNPTVVGRTLKVEGWATSQGMEAGSGAGKVEEAGFPWEPAGGAQSRRRFHSDPLRPTWASALHNCKDEDAVFFFNVKSVMLSCSTDWASWAAQKHITSLEKSTLMFHYCLLSDSNRFTLSSENIAMKSHISTTLAGLPKFWYAEFSYHLVLPTYLFIISSLTWELLKRMCLKFPNI